MKHLNLFIFCTILGTTSAFANTLNPNQITTVLNQLRTTSADTWGEGSYSYEFTNANCNKKYCVIEFKMSKQIGNEFQQPLDQSSTGGQVHSIALNQSAVVSCKIQGASNYADLITTEVNQFTGESFPVLNETFYKKMNTCVTDLETKLKLIFSTSS